MNKQNIVKEFSELVANLLQDELCKDFNSGMLHGFMGLASEAGELLSKYQFAFLDDSLPRTDVLVELSDLLHFAQMLMGRLDSSIEEVTRIQGERREEWEVDLSQGKFTNTDFDFRILRSFVGMAGTSGELLNRYKKFIFYHGEPFSRDDILVGLAKLFYFMQILIDKLDSSIIEVMCINIAKLRTRYPYGYSHDRAITHHRSKEAERAAIESIIEIFTALRSRK